MRIVIATPLYPPEIGGPATYAKILYEKLPALGIEVEIVKFSDVRHLPKLIRHYAFYRRVRRAARQADVIVALDPVSVGLPASIAAYRSHTPFVVKIVGDYAWEQGQQRFGIKETLDEFVTRKRVPIPVQVLRRIQTRVARAATRVIVPSKYLKKIVLTWGISGEKIDVINNAVTLPAHVQIPAKNPDEFLIVSSGRPVPWKGFEAIKRIAESEPGWRFYLAHGLPREEALGWVKAADVFVLNSEYEGLSHALIEAMMLGTPVIATNVGGNPELVTDGEMGLLIPPANDDALRVALKNVAENPSTAHVRAAAAQKHLHTFSLEAMLMRTSDVLKSLI